MHRFCRPPTGQKGYFKPGNGDAVSAPEGGKKTRGGPSFSWEVRQFDVVKNSNPVSRAAYPYLLIFLQADVLDELSSRVVAPLVPAGKLARASVLNPLLVLPEGDCVLIVQQMAALPLASMEEPILANLPAFRNEILAAVDRVFVGF